MEDFDGLWDYNDPAGSERRFRKLLPGIVKTGSDSQRVQLLTQIARTLGLQRRFKEARDMLAVAEAQLEGAGDLARVRWLLETGRCHNSSGSPERSTSFFRDAWELACAAGEDFHAVDAAHMLAIVEPAQEDRLTWTLRALEMAENSSDERAKRWPGSLHNNIGWTWHGQGEYERALGHFRRALEWRERRGEAENIRIARWCIARCLRSLGREAGARPWFARAHTELAQDPWLQEGEPERLERLRRLGQGGRPD